MRACMCVCMCVCVCVCACARVYACLYACASAQRARLCVRMFAFAPAKRLAAQQRDHEKLQRGR